MSCLSLGVALHITIRQIFKAGYIINFIAEDD